MEEKSVERLIGRNNEEITAVSAASDMLELLVDVGMNKVLLNEKERAALTAWLLERAESLDEGEFIEVAIEGGSERIAAIGRDYECDVFVWQKGMPWPLDEPELPVYSLVRQIEKKQYTQNRKAVGVALLNLVQEVSDLYERFFELVGQTDLMLVDMQPYSLLNSLQSCRYQLVLGSLTLLRGHASDSAFYTRKAMEFLAFAVEMWRNPDASKKWLEAGLDPAAQADYRKAFPIAKTLHKARDVSADLSSLYDWMSDFVHPSFQGIVKQCSLENRRHGFDYFDSLNDRENGFLSVMLMNTIFVHLKIIGGFEKLIEQRQTKFDHRLFEAAYRPVLDKLEEERVRLKPICEKFLSS